MFTWTNQASVRDKIWSSNAFHFKNTYICENRTDCKIPILSSACLHESLSNRIYQRRLHTCECILTHLWYPSQTFARAARPLFSPLNLKYIYLHPPYDAAVTTNLTNPSDQIHIMIFFSCYSSNQTRSNTANKHQHSAPQNEINIGNIQL